MLFFFPNLREQAIVSSERDGCDDYRLAVGYQYRLGNHAALPSASI